MLRPVRNRAPKPRQQQWSQDDSEAAMPSRRPKPVRMKPRRENVLDLLAICPPNPFAELRPDVGRSRVLTGPAQPHDGETAVGVPGIAAAVLAVKLGVEAVLPVDRLHRAGPLQFADQPVALGIHVRRNVVSHLSSGVAQPDASVEGCGAEPHGSALISVVPPPETHVVALARAAGDRLLEGKVLLAAEQEQIAYRRVVV